MSLFTPPQIRTGIIRPTLLKLEPFIPYSAARENRSLGTGGQESGFAFRRQIGGGPALSFWQMEPSTHDDCWENYLRYHPGLAAVIELLILNGMPHEASLLETNDAYACAMAEVKYFRSSIPLPAANDADGMWLNYKAVYNTASGAATQSEFLNNWSRWVASNPIS